MDFQEMCIKLFDREYLMAYRKGWPDIVTNVRVTEDKKGNQILVYYRLNQAQIPVPVTKEVIDCDDWVCTDDINDRFSIRSFMTMPKAKEFMLDVKKYMDSPRDRIPEEFHTLEYKLRMDEAVALRLLHADYNAGRIAITDIGYDLIGQIE